MGVIFDEPKYPVIDKAPGFLKTGEGGMSGGDLGTEKQCSLAVSDDRHVLLCSGEFQHE